MVPSWWCCLRCSTAPTPTRASQYKPETATCLAVKLHVAYAQACLHLQVYAEDIDAGSSDSARQLAGFAASNQVTLVAGSMPESSQGKLYNTCLVFDRHGKQIAKHRKVRCRAWLFHLAARRNCRMKGAACRCTSLTSTFLASRHSGSQTP